MIIVIDSIMGSGKTSWAIDYINEKPQENILYVTPYLAEVQRIKEKTKREIFEPLNKGFGKLDNISMMLKNQTDIASTHELFKRFDDTCKQALKDNDYTLILDETLDAVEQYHFQKPDDYTYLIENNDISVDENGLINWTGSELNTRYDDIRILSKNHCLFKVDEKFFIWHFPIEIFKLFKDVYILTYLFPGSIMKYYFDLYNISYEIKSVIANGYRYKLCNYFTPDMTQYNSRFNIYLKDDLINNISQKITSFSSSWFKSKYHKSDINQLKGNIYNFCRNKINSLSRDIMWTSYKHARKILSQKGYTKGFVSCNCRGTNDYCDRTCLIYALNWYVNPEIVKYFLKNDIKVNQDLIALSQMLQWIWRSNIRVKESNKKINIYIPSVRMRTLFIKWLNNDLAL